MEGHLTETATLARKQFWSQKIGLKTLKECVTKLCSFVTLHRPFISMIMDLKTFLCVLHVIRGSGNPNG